MVDLEHLDKNPVITIELDGKEILSEVIDTGRYELEAPMPAVNEKTQSSYRILADGKLLYKGKVERNNQPIQTPAHYVDTRIGTAHSRWTIAPGPWMPFSMVKISPDNQNKGWQASYTTTFQSQSLSRINN